jgi:hypothetical protein
MASRSEKNISAALGRLESEGTGNGEVLSLKLDLGDPRKAKAAAEEFLTMENRLDILSKNFHATKCVPTCDDFRFIPSVNNAGW